MLQIPIGMQESEYDYKRCRIHIQTWMYIHSGISCAFCLIGIALGILLLIYPEWHEHLILYRQFLAYIRRNDPVTYWLGYKVFCICWIFLHLLHFLAIIHTIVGMQLIKPRLVLPQLTLLIIQLGVLLLLLSAVILLSCTSVRAAWISLLLVIIFIVPTCTNLLVLVLYYRFLCEKEEALKAILANTKQVHFKEK